MKEQGIPIKLDVWQITSEFAIIKQYDDELSVMFKFWDSNQNEVLDQVGCLNFSGVWTVKYSRFNKTRYYPNEIEHELKSYYLEIENSIWLDELKKGRDKIDKDWKKYDHRNYKHYVFQNNSYFIEIVASIVEFEIIAKPEYQKNIWDN